MAILSISAQQDGFDPAAASVEIPDITLQRMMRYYAIKHFGHMQVTGQQVVDAVARELLMQMASDTLKWERDEAAGEGAASVPPIELPPIVVQPME